jgi:hypothetical protein
MIDPLVRPPVAELVFRLYDRPLHPELFDVLVDRSVQRPGFTLRVQLTRTGHVLSWTDGRSCLSEATATEGMELPESGCRLAYHFNGNRNGRSSLPEGVRYQISLQTETLLPEQFLHVHEELAIEGARKGLVFHCKSGNRLGPSPLGVVIAQTIPSGVSVSAFHTFPDECALIKTQSLIEWL